MADDNLLANLSKSFSPTAESEPRNRDGSQEVSKRDNSRTQAQESPGVSKRDNSLTQIQENPEVSKRDNSRTLDSDLATNSEGGITRQDFLELRKDQKEQMAIVQELMARFGDMKSDVEKLNSYVPHSDDESIDDEDSVLAGSSATPKPSDQKGDIFQDLAEIWSLGDKKGSNVSENLSNLTQKLLGSTIEEKRRADLMDKYCVPENTDRLFPPKVNQEIWRALETPSRSKDIKLQRVQQYTLRAAVPVLRVIDALIEAKNSPDNLDINHIITSLVDSVALTSIGNAEINSSRRDTIKRTLNEEYQAICSNSNPITTMLFGDNISDQLKSISESNKVGQKIRNVHHRKHPYSKDRNFRRNGPFLGHRHMQGRFQQGRGKGRRHPYARFPQARPQYSGHASMAPKSSPAKY